MPVAPKISLPVPGSSEDVEPGPRAVGEPKSISFRYGKGKDYLVPGRSAKRSLNSRVAISGRNGDGGSTLMTSLRSETSFGGKGGASERSSVAPTRKGPT